VEHHSLHSFCSDLDMLRWTSYPFLDFSNGISVNVHAPISGHRGEGASTSSSPHPELISPEEIKTLEVNPSSRSKSTLLRLMNLPNPQSTHWHRYLPRLPAPVLPPHDSTSVFLPRPTPKLISPEAIKALELKSFSFPPYPT
jgi:hypothetical protein